MNGLPLATDAPPDRRRCSVQERRGGTRRRGGSFGMDRLYIEIEKDPSYGGDRPEEARGK